jgi:hypothetical protein
MSANQARTQEPKEKESKAKYGFSSVSVKASTITRLRDLRVKLTPKDMNPLSMDEVVNKCCTALETQLKQKRND